MAVKAAWPGVSRKVIGAPLLLDLVGADMLGDAAGFARGHIRLADGIQQGGLAVVDVTEDGDHRRARLEVGVIFVGDHPPPERHLARLLLDRLDLGFGDGFKAEFGRPRWRRCQNQRTG